MADPITNTAHVVASPGTAAAIKKPVANVPIYVWGIVIVGALGYSYLKSKKTATTAADGTNTAAPSALVYTGTGGGDTTATDTTATTNVGAYQTNDAWATGAKNYLIGQGVDPKGSSDAVDLYINGQTLTAQQNAWIALAIKAIGPTPQSLPPTVGTTTPPDGGTSNSGDLSAYSAAHVNYQDVGQARASLSGQVYTVKAGDTISSIALKAYNFSDATAYSNLTYAMDEIINANFQKIPDVKNIAPGTQLYIPVLASEMFPNYGHSVPLLGFKPGSQATEWEFGAGVVPQSAATTR
jgi:hypothetical protein